jgi:hypothetical protein
MEIKMASFCVTLFDTIENPSENDACFLASTKDLTLNKGSSYKITFLLSKNENDVNLIGYSLRGEIRSSVTSEEVLLNMTSANQLLEINNLNSSIIMYVPESFTRRVSNPFYYYEVYLLNPLSETSKILQGLITFV